MEALLISILVSLCGTVSIYGTETDPEYPSELIECYRDHVYNFTQKVYKNGAIRSGYHFTASYPSFWLTLAGMAEGADCANRQLLFKLLSLPADRSLRETFYEIAVSRLTLSPYVNINNKRVLMLDENATPLPKWHNYVTKHSLLNVTSGPIKCDPKATADKLRNLMSACFPKLKLRGNSVIFNTIDYNGLWTDAFDDAIIKRAPFYNEKGKCIGSVDLMTTRRRAYIGYLPSIHSKVLALPVGERGEYAMMFGVIEDGTDMKTVFEELKSTAIREALEVIEYSDEPVYIAIPRFTWTIEMDTRAMLQDMGIKNLWTDPAASKYVSSPPALPDHYLLRSTVTFDRDGLNPAPQTPFPCGHTDSEDGLRIFIANKPFMFGLFDTQAYGAVIMGVYSHPTYPD